MMFYQFNKNYIRRKGKNITLSTFNGIDERAHETTLPIRFVKDIRGYRTNGGMLIADKGISEYKTEKGGSLPHLNFQLDNVYSFFVDGKVQLLCSFEGIPAMFDESINDWKFYSDATISGENAVVFTSKGRPSLIVPKLFGGLYSYNGYGFFDLNSPYDVASMCVHMNRLFLVDSKDEYRIRFSKVDDPSNFEVSLDKGGEIYMGSEDGKILAMLSYNSNLYIFREYSIYRLTAYGDQREFVMKRLARTTSKIIDGSIALCGDKVVLLSEEGMCLFDGYNLKRILSNIDETALSIKGKPSAIFFNGRYCLAYNTSKESDENNHVLIYDTTNGDTAIYDGFKVRKFVVLRSVLGRERLAVTTYHSDRLGVMDDSNNFFDTPIENSWSSQNIDFDMPSKSKTILSISVHTGEKYTLEIANDRGETKSIYVNGKHTRYAVNMRGYAFRFSIRSTGKISISSPIVEVKV